MDGRSTRAAQDFVTAYSAAYHRPAATAAHLWTVLVVWPLAAAIGSARCALGACDCDIRV